MKLVEFHSAMVVVQNLQQLAVAAAAAAVAQPSGRSEHCSLTLCASTLQAVATARSTHAQCMVLIAT
jgi:hypothetical protein